VLDGIDLSRFEESIKAREGAAGQNTTDAKILLGAVWPQRRRGLRVRSILKHGLRPEDARVQLVEQLAAGALGVRKANGRLGYQVSAERLTRKIRARDAYTIWAALSCPCWRARALIPNIVLA
jgi:hypothetical protein